MPHELEGYDALDLDHPAYKELSEAQAIKALKFDQKVHRALVETDAGAWLMDMLKERYLRGDMGRHLLDRELRHQAGKRELVLELMQACERAASVPSR